MRKLSSVDRQSLINAIAAREGTGKELAKWYDVTLADLKAFVDDNREAVEMAREAIEMADNLQAVKDDVVTPTQLSELWISNKFERLKRYEEVADLLYDDLKARKLGGAELSTAAREFRSYAQLAANELGQLLHRGSGEGSDSDTLGVDIQGVNIDNLR